MGKLTAEEIVELSKRYTLYDWQAQSKASPIAIERAEGIYFWSVDGKRYIDFNSQLMGVNIGHGDRRVTDAMHRQAERLAYISPFMAYEERALLGQKMAELLPGDIEKSFYTLGGAEANENAIKIARMVTGRHKIMARYRSYHGATPGAMTLTGDPRRWANEPAMSGVVHVLDPVPRPATRRRTTRRRRSRCSTRRSSSRAPARSPRSSWRPVTGTNGILIPPDGYLQGVRELCTKYGILMVSDEVMCGFGRTGEWFAVNHWDVVPDIITCAKGLTSSYAPLGALGMRPEIAEHFEDNVFWGGLTYNTHPVSVRRGARHDRRLRRGRPDRAHAQDGRRDGPAPPGAEGQASVGGRGPQHRAVRRARPGEEPRDDGADVAVQRDERDVMASVNRFLLDNGLYTMIHWWTLMTNPPLPITEEQLAEGFEIIDRALEIADAAVEE